MRNKTQSCLSDMSFKIVKRRRSSGHASEERLAYRGNSEEIRVENSVGI